MAFCCLSLTSCLAYTPAACLSPRRAAFFISASCIRWRGTEVTVINYNSPTSHMTHIMVFIVDHMILRYSYMTCIIVPIMDHVILTSCFSCLSNPLLSLSSSLFVLRSTLCWDRICSVVAHSTVCSLLV